MSCNSMLEIPVFKIPRRTLSNVKFTLQFYAWDSGEPGHVAQDHGQVLLAILCLRFPCLAKLNTSTALALAILCLRFIMGADVGDWRPPALAILCLRFVSAEINDIVSKVESLAILCLRFYQAVLQRDLERSEGHCLAILCLRFTGRAGRARYCAISLTT